MRKHIPCIILLLLLINMVAPAQNPTPPTPCTTLGQTDSTAFPVCGSAAFQQGSVPLCGNYPLPVPPCFGDGYVYTDINPYFYKFTCFQTGTLGFLITPNNPTDDYDWQLFDITNHSPAEIYTNDSLFVACDWSGNTGPTGANATGTSISNCGGYGYPPISAMPTIYIGHDYLLLISHFTTSQQGYSLTFSGGTSVITDSLPPKATQATVSCDGTRVSIKLNKQMLCNSLDPDGSDFIITGNPAFASIKGVGCQNGFDMDSVVITLAKPLPAGNYSVISEIGTDHHTILDVCGNGIPANDTFPFKVVKQYPTLLDSISPLPCAPQQLQLVFQKPILCSSIDTNGSQFKITGPSKVTVANASIFCDSINQTNIITLNLANPIAVDGTYTIKLRNGVNFTTIINECSVPTPAGDSLNFYARGFPKASFTPIIKYGCRVDTIEYKYTGGNNVTSWHWYFDSTLQSTASDTSIIYNVLTPKQATLIVSNGVCSDTSKPAPLTIDLLNGNDTVKAGFEILKLDDGNKEIATFICPNEQPIFTDTSIGKINEWLWQFGDNTVSTSKDPYGHTYPAKSSAVNYTVALIVKGDYCHDTAYQTLKVVPNCYIAVPSGFSPNGDNVNDYLYPLNAYKADNLDFKVYNRFGQLIFETADWTKKWDGTYKGKEQPTGTYVWMLNYTDHDSKEQVSLKGTSVLVR